MTRGHPTSRNGGRVVAVYGASGHTGRFVVAELLRRGITPIAIGRDEARLAASGFPDHAMIEARVATVEDAAAIDKALAGAMAVINCAGPFLDTAEPLVTAAIRARVHYLDVTAEQASALVTLERFAEPAREAAIIAVPAMGFWGGLCDLLVTAAMGDWTSADDIRIGTALDSWHPTQGTRITGERNTYRRLMIVGGKLEPLPSPAPAASWKFPQPFGVQEVIEVAFSETAVISHHLRISNLHHHLNLAPLRDLNDVTTPPPSPADETGRSAQVFLVDVIARNGLTVRRAIARGRDIYAFTAPLVVEAAQRILDGEVKRRGVLAPGQMFDAPTFLRSLAPKHLSFEIAVDDSVETWLTAYLGPRTS